MKKVSTVLTTIAIIVIIALLAIIFFKQRALIETQKQQLEESKTIITAKIDDLYAKLDADTIVQIKECEIKAMQTIINIFSPHEITKESTLEYSFDFFSDEAYEYYLLLRRTFAGQHLITESANGSGYDTRTKKIDVFVSLFSSGFEGRSQFNFTFTKVEDNWIVESFDSDA